MEAEKKLGNKVGRIFQHNLLEKMTRTHTAVPVVLYLIIAYSFIAHASRAYTISTFSSSLLVFLGFTGFTLAEYVFHRFLFHFEAVTEIEKKIQYIIHGIHHHDPKDRKRLAMPLPASISLAGIYFMLFYQIMEKNAMYFFPGFITGYAVYLSVHHAVHAFRPPKNPLRYWWKHHHIHHYGQNDRAFGVSSPLWDYVFRTMPRKKDRSTGKN
jgi:sterol desaturase/sphingolipid hydroxylase (fatty acid hydroxylase superfamily)